MTSPDPDRLRYAQIAGAVARHALGWRLTADEEARAITEAIRRSNGNKRLAAQMLGISRDTLYRKIHELNLPVSASDSRT